MPSKSLPGSKSCFSRQPALGLSCWVMALRFSLTDMGNLRTPQQTFRISTESFAHAFAGLAGSSLPVFLSRGKTGCLFLTVLCCHWATQGSVAGAFCSVCLCGWASMGGLTPPHQEESLRTNDIRHPSSSEDTIKTPRRVANTPCTVFPIWTYVVIIQFFSIVFNYTVDFEQFKHWEVEPWIKGATYVCIGRNFFEM